MKQIKKVIYSFTFLLLGMLVVNAQNEKNLFRNGDFENGSTEGWNLGRDFHIANESGYYYVKSDNYVGQYQYPRISTDNQEVVVVPGATYTFSFYGKNLQEGEYKANFILKNSNGDGVNLNIDNFNPNSFSFDIVEDGAIWRKFQKVITFPQNVDIAKLTSFGISLTGNNKANKGISEIHMVKTRDAPVVPTPPAGFGVAEDMLFQRAAKFTWEAEEGKVYKLELNGKTYTIENGNSFYVYGLTPNTEYTAQLYTDTDTEERADVTFTTTNYIESNEENRIPFLANIDENGSIAKIFRYHINDLSGAKITAIEFTLDGTPADNQNGVITLPDVSGGKLMVKVTQEGGVITTLTYNLVNINQ